MISLSSASSLLTLSSVDGWVSISPVRNFFLYLPKGLTIHRLAVDASLKVFVWDEHPCSSSIRALASAIGFPVSLADPSSAPYSRLLDTPKRMTVDAEGRVRNITRQTIITGMRIWYWELMDDEISMKEFCRHI